MPDIDALTLIGGGLLVEPVPAAAAYCLKSRLLRGHNLFAGCTAVDAPVSVEYIDGCTACAGACLGEGDMHSC